MDQNKVENARISWNEVFIKILETLSMRSTCSKLQTAAIIVRDKNIISSGYNGTACGDIECSTYWRKYHEKNNISVSFNEWIKTSAFRDLHRDWSTENEIHAELNTLRWISKNEIDKCELYTLYSPCKICAKEIIAYGVKTIYYKFLYKNDIHPIKKLEENNIKCIQII